MDQGLIAVCVLTTIKQDDQNQPLKIKMARKINLVTLRTHQVKVYMMVALAQ